MCTKVHRDTKILKKLQPHKIQKNVGTTKTFNFYYDNTIITFYIILSYTNEKNNRSKFNAQLNVWSMWHPASNNTILNKIDMHL